MKKSIITCVVALSFISLNCFSYNNREEDMKFKEERKKWYNDMHCTKDGISWKVLNYEVRNSKFKNKQEIIKNKLDKGEALQSESETFADGKIVGKWIERGSNNVSGRIRTAWMDYDNNKLYAASDGGNIWVSDPSVRNWTCLNEMLNFNEVRHLKLINTGSSNRIFAACNGPSKCYYSDNNGILWNEASGLENVTNWGSIKRVLTLDDPSNTIFILAHEWDNNTWQSIVKLYISNNNGTSFSAVDSCTDALNFCDIWAQKYDASVIYFYNGHSLKSLDLNGSTLSSTEISLGTMLSSVYDIRMKGEAGAEKPLIFFAITTNGDDDPSQQCVKFLQYDLSNGNFKINGKIEDFNFFSDNSWEVSSIGDSYMVCGGVNAYYSADNGETWDLINEWGEYYGDIENKLHADIPGVFVFKNPNKAEEETFICTDGGIFYSDDYCSHVKNYSMNTLNTSQYYSTYTYRQNTNIIFAGAQDQGYQVSVPGTDAQPFNFKQVISGDYGHLVSSDGGNVVWGNYPGFTIVYAQLAAGNEYGYTWDFRGSNWLWLPPIVADPSNSQRAYVMSGGEEGSSNIWELTFNASQISYNKMEFNFNPENDYTKVSYLAISNNNKNLWYAITTNGKIYKSTDAGNNWNNTCTVLGADAHYFYGNKILIDPTNDNKVYIAGSGSDESPFYYSNDGGNTFIKANDGIPQTLIFDIEISSDGNWIFAASEVGPYAYNTTSHQWYDIAGMKTPDQTYWSVEYLDDMKTARFATYGRGIWDLKIESLSDVKENYHNQYNNIEVKVSPIPASESIKIDFELNDDSYSELKIYNLEGKIIDVIYSGYLIKGSYNFNWNFSKSFASKLPKGTYFCLLSAMNKAQYVKFVIE